MSPVKRQNAASDACGGSIYFLNAAGPEKWKSGLQEKLLMVY